MTQPVVQIFGTAKCRNTQKALRFFKERGLATQFIDISVKPPSKGELASAAKSVPYEDMIDTEGKLYETLNLKYIRHNAEEELLANPMLLKTPLVRAVGKAAVGFEPEFWQQTANSFRE